MTETRKCKGCDAEVSRLAHSPAIPWRRIGDTILLAPPGREDFDHLSGTAAVVWGLLETPATLESLIDRLGELYSVPAESISADVVALVADLTQLGAVQEVP
jgi:hypothetical protein